MILHKYNLKLRSLGQADLEMVRIARNSEFIRSKMIYREDISEQQQQMWYNSLNPLTDLYFVIEDSKMAHGLINVKNINYESDESESGLFIWNSAALLSPIPVVASWIISEAGYGFLGGTHNTIRVLKNNTEAINFNKKMGFAIVEENDNSIIMQQTVHSFSAATLADRTRMLNKSNNSLIATFGDHEHDSIRFESFKKYAKITACKVNFIDEKTISFPIDF